MIDQSNESYLVVPNLLSCMLHVNKDVCDKESHVEQVSLVQKKQVLDFIEINRIEFIIPEHSISPASCAS